MTGTRDPQKDGSIQAMLSDSGLESAAELRSALEQLRAVVPDRAPAPRADLAALLTAGAAGPAAPVSATTTVLPAVSAVTTALPTVASAKDSAGEALPTGATSLAERRGRKRRLAIVGGAVIGAMSLGAGAVAASSEDFRHSVSRTVGVIFQPAEHPAPATGHVQPSHASVPAVPGHDATPAVTGTQCVPPAGTHGAASPCASSDGKTHPTTAPTAPPAVGRDGVLPTPSQRPVTPGSSGKGNGNGKDLPSHPGNVPSTKPGVVPTKAPGQP